MRDSSGGREQFPVLAKPDIDRKVGEDVGHLRAIAKLRYRRVAAADEDAAQMDFFDTRRAGTLHARGGIAEQVFVLRIILGEISESIEHVFLVDRARYLTLREVETDGASDIQDVHFVPPFQPEVRSRAGSRSTPWPRRILHCVPKPRSLRLTARGARNAPCRTSRAASVAERCADRLGTATGARSMPPAWRRAGPPRRSS